MGIDPIRTAYNIKHDFIRYLLTTYYFQNKEIIKQYREQLFSQDKEKTLFKGPYLEITSPYEADKTLKDLVNENILCPQMETLLNSKLYVHQEISIRKICTEKHNIIVATGTGSGKTECFIFPILNHLFTELNEGKLTPGVRALLLYPMNALANDQLKRLRKLLINYPQITFGRYTGETKDKYNDAINNYKVLGIDPPINELICRDDIKKTPPHILLTNYAMLEYLLLRPQDSVLFDNNTWKYFVLDEIHTYTGSKGLEISMLLSRLKERVVQSERNVIRCIGTSATLSDDKDKNIVAEFASKLFNENFNDDDIITSKRIKLSDQMKPQIDIPIDIYKKLFNIINNNIGFDVTEEILSLINSCNLNKYIESSKSIEHILWELLIKDCNMQNIISILEDSPCDLFELAEKLHIEPEEIFFLVEVGLLAKNTYNNQVLLPAKYHFFIRALEGAYLRFLPEINLRLQSRKEKFINGINYKYFEIASCRRCGAFYLVGKTSSDNVLEQSSYGYIDETDAEEYYLCQYDNFSISENDELDEDEQVIDQDLIINDPLEADLCPRCGKINSPCNCNEKKLKLKKNNNYNKLCINCMNRSEGIITRILTGQDAPVSVLSTSLYSQLKPTSISTASNDSDQDWETFNSSKIIDSKKLLIFSDSRQNAAYFAGYLNLSQEEICFRKLILLTIHENKAKIIDNEWTIGDLIPLLIKNGNKYGLFNNKRTHQEKENEVTKWIYREFVGLEKKNSLEGLGLIGFRIIHPLEGPAFNGLTNPPYELKKEEVLPFIQILIDTIRNSYAINLPQEISTKDINNFLPDYQFKFNLKTDTKNHVIGWIPSDNRINKRISFVQKVFPTFNNDNLNQCLNRIFRNVLMKDPVITNIRENNGNGYIINPTFWKILPGDNLVWFQCTKCRQLTHLNIRNICPRNNCDGELTPCNPEEILSDNHYRSLYSDYSNIESMVVEEHTAQLTSQEAARIQERFIKGEVNVLSCSTTFELGVDVGELETVLLKNIPPSTANYIQRAGRAGRKTGSAAFVVTYAQRSPFDLGHFQNPMKMIFGTIKAPSISIHNEKIISRHAWAMAFSMFWKENEKRFGTVDSFYYNNVNNDITAGTEEFITFLNQKPTKLKNSLMKVIPSNIMDIDNWNWINEMGEFVVLLKRTRDLITTDITNLEMARNELILNNKKSDHILDLIKTFKDKQILNYLASNSLLPKYGFPVDVVNLDILGNPEDAANIELSRDLKVAISEYAPGSKIIAKGKEWESYAIKRVPNHEWETYNYAICGCGRLNKELSEKDPENKKTKTIECKSCHKAITLNKSFIIPVFGFVTKIKAKPGKITKKRPQKYYSTRAYFSGEKGLPDKHHEQEIGKLKVIVDSSKNGELVVINKTPLFVCSNCGFSSKKLAKSGHSTYYDKSCTGKLERKWLGHSYRTDVCEIYFDGYIMAEMSWYSILYALLESVSEILETQRNDIDGCIFPKPQGTYSLILFDSVPGGAGLVHHLANEKVLIESLRNARKKTDGRCGCSPETSCFGCLRNYQNQFCHDYLNRQTVLDFIPDYI